MSHNGGIFLLKAICIERVKTSRYIRGEHARMCQSSTQLKGAAFTSEFHNLSNAILKETACHASGTYRANFLFIHEKGNGSALNLRNCKLCSKRGVCANTVVLAVAQNHRAVEAHLTGSACGYYFNFSGQEIFFVDVVLLFEKI